MTSSASSNAFSTEIDCWRCAASNTGSATRSCALAFAIIRSTIGGIALRLVERRQIVHRCDGVRMERTDGLFADRKRPLEQRLGVGITTLPLVEVGKIVQRS